MARTGHWPVEVWKDAVIFWTASGPLLPYYSTNAIELTENDASGTDAITVVRTLYYIRFTATVVLDSANKAPYRPDWWADLYPMWAIDPQPYAPPPHQSPWPNGTHSTKSTASGGFSFNVVSGGLDNATGRGTQTAVWEASGNTEGMRKFAAGTSVQVRVLAGVSFNSFLAGYASLTVPVSWAADGYVKTLFGSTNTIV